MISQADELMREFALDRNARDSDVAARISYYIDKGQRRKAIRLGRIWKNEVNPQAAESASAHFYFQWGLAYLLHNDFESAWENFQQAAQQPGYNSKMRGDIHRDLMLYYIRRPGFARSPELQQKALHELVLARSAHTADPASTLIDMAAEARLEAARGNLRTAIRDLNRLWAEYGSLPDSDPQHLRNLTFKLMVMCLRNRQLFWAGEFAGMVLEDSGELWGRRKLAARAVRLAAAPSRIRPRRHGHGRM